MKFIVLFLFSISTACSSVDYSPVRIDSFASIEDAPRFRQALRDLKDSKTPVSLGSIIDQFEEFRWSRQDHWMGPPLFRPEVNFSRILRCALKIAPDERVNIYLAVLDKPNLPPMVQEIHVNTYDEVEQPSFLVDCK